MNTTANTTLGVLLAAGAGSRFQGPEHKLLATVHGEPVIALSVRSMASSGLSAYGIVTGAADLSDFAPQLAHINNSDWRSGQRSSVVAAIAYARANRFDSLVIGLADQPFITPDCWRAVAACDSPIAIATYEGVRGNPVKLASSVWDTFLQLDSPADEGARTLIRLHPELVREVACGGNDADIDTTEDVEQWT
jgi:molybdenum cofactor cytidylyltransferase